MLFRPRDPNNIGACARAAANFGVTELAVVAPHPPVWREAKSAVGAGHLLRSAKEAATLDEAVADCRAVLGTSCLKGRRLALPMVALPDWEPEPGRTALVFGPEKTGLSAEELSRCSAVLCAPTAAETPSMNLAAAVAVCCYQWSLGRRKPLPSSRMGPAVRADGAARERLLRQWESLFGAVGYRQDLPAGARAARFRRALSRWRISEEDAGMLGEIARRALESVRPSRSS